MNLHWHIIISQGREFIWRFPLNVVHSMTSIKYIINCRITQSNCSAYFPYSTSVQFSSVSQSCPTLCNPMDCSTPGFPVPGAYSNSCPSSQWCHPTISSSVVPFSSHLQSFSVSGSFPMSQFFAAGGQSIGVSASALVLPMNIQDWFPLSFTGWISLLSNRLSGVFFNTTVQKHLFFGAQLSL